MKLIFSLFISLISLYTIAQSQISQNGLKDINSDMRIGVTLQSGAGDAQTCISKNSQLGRLVLREFNMVQTTCYPSWETWKGYKEYDFNGFNKVVNWSTDHQLPVAAHLLAGPDLYFPDWFKEASYANSELDTLLSDFIRSIMTSNKNGQKVEYWNVVNEFILNDGTYINEAKTLRSKFEQLGMEEDRSGLTGDARVNDSHPVYVRKAFEYARKYTDGKLELRDFGIAFWGDQKSKGFYQMVLHLINSGVPIDAIGFQAHFHLDKNYEWDRMTKSIQEYRKLGLEVYLTEVDFASKDTWNDQEAQRQKEQYKQMMSAAMEGGANWVCFWGVRDNWNKHWRYNQNPLLFDENLNEKPAYNGIKEALERRATTTNREMQTRVSIEGNQFHINGKQTYEGRYWKGHKIEGLLINSRMVQGVFDDMNPETAQVYAYPDTKKWDAARNNDEFVAAMSEWKSYGMNSFSLNMQGGSPNGYHAKPCLNPGFNPDGSLIDGYMQRLDNILKRADELEMVVILGFFYFRQDENLKDEQAIINATTNMMNWLHDKGYRNVLIEISNETHAGGLYDHEILLPHRIHELIELAKRNVKNGYAYPVSTSFGGCKVPTSNVVKASDYLLIHGNGANTPERLTQLAIDTRNVEGYREMPIVNNEDDHFDFDKETNNFSTSMETYVSWGYLDFRFPGETEYTEGYQSVPVDWGINSERKKAFFNYVKEVTGTK